MAIGWMLGGALTAVGAYCLRKSGLKHQGIDDYLDEARARRWARETEARVDREVADIKARLAWEARERAAREAAEIKERIRREARAEQRRHSRQWAGHRNPEPEQERPGNASGGRGTGGARKTPPRGSNDPFTVLGVASGADKAAIKTAYRCLAKAAHPDKNPGDPQAAEQFRRIQKAYSEALKAAKD